MARLTGPRNRLARREGVDLYLRSIDSPKAMLTRDFPPGQHGHSTKGKLSNYGTQLREKQKLKRIYGILEKQFRNYFIKASKTKEVTGHALLRFLEQRLDNVVYRAGFAVTRRQARQMVSHGAVEVNGRKVNIPSFQVDTEDQVRLKVAAERGKKIQETHEKIKDSLAHDWIDTNAKELTATIKRLPQRTDINFPIQEQLIVELYSK